MFSSNGYSNIRGRRVRPELYTEEAIGTGAVSPRVASSMNSDDHHKVIIDNADHTPSPRRYKQTQVFDFERKPKSRIKLFLRVTGIILLAIMLVSGLFCAIFGTEVVLSSITQSNDLPDADPSLADGAKFEDEDIGAPRAVPAAPIITDIRRRNRVSPDERRRQRAERERIGENERIARDKADTESARQSLEDAHASRTHHDATESHHELTEKEHNEFIENFQAFDSRERVILLSSGQGLWNTGVWPGWGHHPRAQLNWAAAGVVVDKQCDVKCRFTFDEDQITTADAVVMETINHLKFLGKSEAHSIPIPWPQQRDYPFRDPTTDEIPSEKSAHLPVLGQFYFEPTAGDNYDFTAAPALRSHFDFRVVPDANAEIPITLVCPWGHQREDFMLPPPHKSDERFIAYFNEHGIADQFIDFIDELFKLAGADNLHSFINRSNRPIPVEAGGDPYALKNRLRFVGTYRFALITESIVENDWVSPEWSQALLAGTVPIYAGASNIKDFAPNSHSYIDISDFNSAEELWNLLQSLRHDEDAYMRYFDWKNEPQLPANLANKLDQCAHYAECRICKQVTKIT